MYRDQRRVGKRDQHDYDDPEDHIRELERQIEEKRRRKAEQEREERKQLEEYYSKPNEFAVGEREKAGNRIQRHQRQPRRVHPVLGKPPTPIEKKRSYESPSSNKNLSDRERRHQERMRAYYHKKQDEISRDQSPPTMRHRGSSHYREPSPPSTTHSNSNDYDKMSVRERKWEEKRRRRMAKQQNQRQPSPPTPDQSSYQESSEYRKSSFQNERPDPEHYETQRERAFREKREKFLRDKERKMGIRNDTEEEYQRDGQDSSMYEFDQSPEPHVKQPYFDSPSHRRQSYPSPARGGMMDNIGSHDAQRHQQKAFDHGIPHSKHQQPPSSKEDDYSFFDKIGKQKQKSFVSHDIPQKQREVTPQISGPSFFDKIGAPKRKKYFNHDIPAPASSGQGAKHHPKIITPDQGAGLFDKLGSQNRHKKPFDHSIPKSPYKQAEHSTEKTKGGLFDKLGAGHAQRTPFNHDIPSPSRRMSEPERRIPTNGKGLFDNLGEHDRAKRRQNKFDHAIPNGLSSPQRHEREMNEGFGGKGVLDDLGNNQDYRRKNYEHGYQHHVPPSAGYDAKRQLAQANENAGNFMSGIGGRDDRYQRRVAAQQENMALLSKFNQQPYQPRQQQQHASDMHSPSNKVEKITNWNQGISSDQVAAQKQRKMDYAAELRAQMAEKQAKKKVEDDKRRKEDEVWEAKYGWKQEQNQKPQQQPREAPAQPTYHQQAPSSRAPPPTQDFYQQPSTQPSRNTPVVEDEHAPRSLRYAEPNAVAEKHDRLAKQRELRAALEQQRAEAEAKRNAEKRRREDEERREQEKLDAYYSKMREDQEKERNQKKQQQQQLNQDRERQQAAKRARENADKQMSLEAHGAHLPGAMDRGFEVAKPSGRPRPSLVSEQQAPSPSHRQSTSRQSVHTSDIHSDLTPSLPPDTPPVHRRRGRRESIAPEDRPTTSGSSRAIQDELDKLKDAYKHDNAHLKEELEMRLNKFKQELRDDHNSANKDMERANHSAFDREMNANLKSRNPTTNRMLKNIVLQDSMDNASMMRMNHQVGGGLDQSLGGESHFVYINAARPLSSHSNAPIDYSARPDTATSDISIASSVLPKPSQDKQLERLERENESRLRHLNNMLQVDNPDDKRSMLSDYLNNNSKIELLPDPLGDDDYRPRRPTSGSSTASSSHHRRRRRKHKMIQPPHRPAHPQASIPSQRAFVDPSMSHNPLDDDDE